MERETRAMRQMTDSPMLRLFREGATNYQPAVQGVNGLAPRRASRRSHSRTFAGYSPPGC